MYKGKDTHLLKVCAGVQAGRKSNHHLVFLTNPKVYTKFRTTLIWLKEMKGSKNSTARAESAMPGTTIKRDQSVHL